MKIIIITIAIVMTIVIAAGCSKGSGDGKDIAPPPPPPVEGTSCNGVNAAFTADVFPIIQSKCATNSGCHGDGSFNGPGALTTFTKIKNAADRIKSAVNAGRMPLGGSLTATELKKLNCWIDSGSPNN